MFCNIEVQWLLEDIRPNYQSICDFRKDNYTDLVGLEKVNGEHSLIMLVYNIKRSINILGVPDLIAKIQALEHTLQRKGLSFYKNDQFKAVFSCFKFSN